MVAPTNFRQAFSRQMKCYYSGSDLKEQCESCGGTNLCAHYTDKPLDFPLVKRGKYELMEVLKKGEIKKRFVFLIGVAVGQALWRLLI